MNFYALSDATLTYHSHYVFMSCVWACVHPRRRHTWFSYNHAGDNRLEELTNKIN